MKKLVVLVGPNGVGKSTTAEIFMKQHPKCAYVEADACRAMNPFPLTPATKKTVIENIYCLFKNYLLCVDIETIVFPYGFHGERKEIFDTVIRRLIDNGITFEMITIVLKCSLEENIKRAVANGRDKERVERGIKNTFRFYDGFNEISIDTTNLSPKQVVNQIQTITDSYKGLASI
ncbi:MAG: hypothetical protein J1E00_08505 [Oscillospiraceae bacterium]|nr:hypothetical protein [Oscillospiraceae bacterium]